MINLLAKIYGTNPNARRLDELTYNYYAGANRLEYIDDNVPQGNWTTDIDDQGAGNYGYDAIGNLTKDAKEKIKQIEWTVYGKVKRIIHLNKNDPTLNFTYDAQGNRVIKAIIFPSLILVPGMGGPTIYKPNPNNVTTYYVRDASGNIMAIYEKTLVQNKYEYRLKEIPIYGSAMVGEYKPNVLVKEVNVNNGNITVPTLTSTTIYTRNLGKRELTVNDHLSSVRCVLGDRKFSTITGGVPTDFTSEVLSVQNTYPGGFLEVGRNYNTTQSRFGYTGKESIDEVYGVKNLYDLDERLYDPRILRIPTTDALFRSYPWYTPYQYAGNNPIWAIDLEGLEEYIVNNRYNPSGQLIRTRITIVRDLKTGARKNSELVDRNGNRITHKKVIEIHRYDNGKMFKSPTFTDELDSEQKRVMKEGEHNQNRVKSPTSIILSEDFYTSQKFKDVEEEIFIAEFEYQPIFEIQETFTANIAFELYNNSDVYSRLVQSYLDAVANRIIANEDEIIQISGLNQTQYLKVVSELKKRGVSEKKIRNDLKTDELVTKEGINIGKIVKEKIQIGTRRAIKK
ncbi:MAG: hypothetical protein HYY40_05450 [Bacteroidetes bacterium]|nr:hypothetical protein [Bacteroidota bacterium]